MSTLNKLKRVFTREGAPAKAFTPADELKRTLMNCLLWEDQFYENGVSIADRIKQLVPLVEPERVAALAITAREDMKLRHAPLLVLREMARHATHRGLVADTLVRVIQRPDEMTELLAIYWADALGPMQQRKRQPISAQIKKGLARAVTKFDAYQLAKYDRDGAVRIRDVLFLVHAKPKDAEQEKVWKQLVEGELSAPDTWEVSLSTGGEKRETFERLIAEKKLGGLALLRNLRLMQKAEVPRETIAGAIEAMRVDRILPYRFITAARYAPDFEPELEVRDAEVDQGPCAAERPHAALDRRLGIDGRGVVPAVRDDAARGGVRPGDPGARNLRKGRDLHLLERCGEDPAPPRLRAPRRDRGEPAACRDVSRQGGQAGRPQGRPPDRLHGRAEPRQGRVSARPRLHDQCRVEPARRRKRAVAAGGRVLGGRDRVDRGVRARLSCEK